MKLLTATLIIALGCLFMPGKNEITDRKTGKNPKPLFSFGLIADIQYADTDPAGTRYYRESSGKLKEALDSMKYDSAEFIINLGDIIDRDFVSFKPVLKIIDDSGLPVHHITGNHDYNVEPGLRKKLPLKIPPKGYYSFTRNKFRFIFLNGNEISIFATDNTKKENEAALYIEALRKSGNKNAIEWNGGIGKNQLFWLEKELERSEEKAEKVFIFCHYPVWPENQHNLLNYREVLSRLKKHNNIIAWINGHNHTGNYGNINKTHFITIKGMVETVNTNSWAVVEVFPDKIIIKGYGREKSQTFSF